MSSLPHLGPRDRNGVRPCVRKLLAGPVMTMTPTVGDLAARVGLAAATPLPELEHVVTALGACQYAPDPSAWWIGRRGRNARQVAADRAQAADALMVCDGCPVRDRCMALAVLTGDTRTSVRGGLVPAELAAVAREVTS